MAAVDQHLVNRRDRLILLLTPPFDRTPRDPGYIKGYVPGIRENGGQYTHAAVWTVLAFVALGDGDKAAELFRTSNPIHRVASRSNVQRYESSPTWRYAPSTPSLRMSGVEAGPGTAGRRAGSIGPVLNGCLASAYAVPRSVSILVFLATGPRFHRFPYHWRCITLRLRIRAMQPVA